MSLSGSRRDLVLTSVMPPKLETSTTRGTDLNSFSSFQSSNDFSSMLS